MYHVLLYYKICNIKHPELEIKKHREVCKALQLKGRILIGKDGINGTVGGSKESIDMYQAYMNEHRVYAGIDFKASTSDIDPFPRLKVRARKEIITTDVREEFNLCRRGNHVDRDTFHQWLVNKEDMVILDMRNDYEWEIGRFVNSVRPPMKYFRDLKDAMDFYEQFKDKKIVMFCTGGVRCEPASAYFIEKGFDPKQIYQLEGGIIKYAEKYGDEGYYAGKCFVFDERIAVPVDTTENAKVVGSCRFCENLNDTYRNCAYKSCNLLFLACDACNEQHENTCSAECQDMCKDPNELRPPRAKTLHRNK